MGKHKDVGDCFLTLAEECNELSQAILKKYRFGGEWDSEVEGTGKTRKQLVQEEMDDVMYQMQRCWNSWDSDDEPDDSGSDWEEYLHQMEQRERDEQEEIERGSLVNVVEQDMDDADEWDEWEDVRLHEVQHLTNLEYELETMERELRDAVPPRVDYSDIEDVSDAYQARLEYNWWADDMRANINRQIELIANYKAQLKERGML